MGTRTKKLVSRNHPRNNSGIPATDFYGAHDTGRLKATSTSLRYKKVARSSLALIWNWLIIDSDRRIDDREFKWWRVWIASFLTLNNLIWMVGESRIKNTISDKMTNLEYYQSISENLLEHLLCYPNVS